jgi:energy-coupling factor transporter transmembrane protein EcfT
MNWIFFVIIILVVLIGITLLFKLAKFVFKLASLVLLLALIIWAGVYVYNLASEPTKLYVLKHNDSEYSAYDLSGQSYNFTSLNSEEFNQTIILYKDIFILDRSTLNVSCETNESTFDCVKSLKNKKVWVKYDPQSADS